MSAENTSIEASTSPATVIPRPTMKDRRLFYRVKLDFRFSITIRAWKIGPYVYVRDKPKPSQEIRAVATEISAGGMAMTMLGTAEVVLGDRLRLEIKGPGMEEPMLIDSRVRRVSTVDDKGNMRVGVHFKGRDTELETRKVTQELAKLMAVLQRQELKNRRDAM